MFVFRDATNANRLLVRNLGAENEAIARLERAGFARTVDGYEMRDARRVVRFFAFDFPALPSEWEISVAPRLEKASHELEPVAPTIEIVRSGEDWFELKYSVATAAGEGIPLAEVQRLLRSGQNQTRLTNGKIAVLNPDALDDFEQVLRDADPRQSQPGVYRLKKIQAGYLTNTAEEIGARLVGASQTLAAATSHCMLSGSARSAGSCATINAPACLARRARRAKSRRNPGRRDGPRQNGADSRFPAPASRHGPALIVCPTSLLSNWQREAERFTPELKVLRIDGANRAEKIARSRSTILP